MLLCVHPEVGVGGKGDRALVGTSCAPEDGAVGEAGTNEDGEDDEEFDTGRVSELAARESVAVSRAGSCIPICTPAARGMFKLFM